ncbi:hypothetical protein RA267_28915, partial [Pseudomonas syringae pv. tagetis]|uniref:hypothetical protein n=1 Tax=Pseudomonas syringae group genomosp. 7 TaxID=251699 RepID=UPI00377015D5
PYIDNSFVLVNRKDQRSPSNLEQMDGKRMAITQGRPMLDWLRRKYTRVVPLEFDNPFQAVDMLTVGRTEGAGFSLLSAAYV